MYIISRGSINIHVQGSTNGTDYKQRYIVLSHLVQDEYTVLIYYAERQLPNRLCVCTYFLIVDRSVAFTMISYVINTGIRYALLKCTLIIICIMHTYSCITKDLFYMVLLCVYKKSVAACMYRHPKCIKAT